MTYTEIKEKGEKTYYYRVKSIRKGEKVNKQRIYLGVNLKKHELKQKEQDADKQLLNAKEEVKEKPVEQKQEPIKQIKIQENQGKRDNKGISVKKENMSDWYTEVVQKAELADYAPIRGFMIMRPNAYAIWEKIQAYFNERLKLMNIKNAYFPLLIPESFFKKEAEHAKGFAPELAYIKNTEDGEKLAIRPTSETIIYDSYSKWIRSYKDLPYKLNQWCNILRWEVKQTKPFLRTREFLWQEGHDAFATEKEAAEDAQIIINEYRKLVEELLAIPVLMGKKSILETFAGARNTYTIEALMPDGKALQCGTSHNLEQGFSKVFNITFLDEKGEKQHVYQTSWGFTTRLIGALIMVHGDDKGLILPPKIAPNQIVIIPILFDKTKEKTIKKANEIKNKLSKFNPLLDERTEYSPGFKFNEYELKGIPLRIEIGPRDLEKNQVTVARRDTGEKISVPEKELEKKVEELLNNIQKNLFEKAKKFLDSRIDSAKTLEELKEKIKQGKIVKAYFLNDIKIEEQIKAETGATSRIIEETKKEGVCIMSGKKSNIIGYFADSY